MTKGIHCDVTSCTDCRAQFGNSIRAVSVLRFKRISARCFGLFVGSVKLTQALVELGLIDEYEFIVHRMLAGHGPTLFAGLSKHVDLKHVSQLKFGSGAVSMRYEPR